MVDALGFVFRQPQKIQHARKSLGNVMGVLGRAYSDGIKKLNYQAWGHGMWEIGPWFRTGSVCIRTITSDMGQVCPLLGHGSTPMELIGYVANHMPLPNRLFRGVRMKA